MRKRRVRLHRIGRKINARSEMSICAGAAKLHDRQRIVGPGTFVRRKSMKAYAVGLAAVLGIATPSLADTATSRIQIAQAASDSGAQSGSNSGTAQRGSREGEHMRSGDRAQGAAGSSGTRTSEGRHDAQHDRTSVRANVRIGGGDHQTTRSRTYGSRTTIHRQVSGGDGVVVRHKKARRYVYSEPSSVVVKRKKVRRYVDGGSTAIVHHRRGVAVSSRTSVREGSGTSVNVRGSTTTRSTTSRSGERSSGTQGANVRMNTSGQGSGRASGSTQMRNSSGSGSSGSGSSGSGSSGAGASGTGY
jgi:hypothetical protein